MAPKWKEVGLGLTTTKGLKTNFYTSSHLSLFFSDLFHALFKHPCLIYIKETFSLILAHNPPCYKKSKSSSPQLWRMTSAKEERESERSLMSSCRHWTSLSMVTLSSWYLDLERTYEEIPVPVPRAARPRRTEMVIAVGGSLRWQNSEEEELLAWSHK